MKRRAKREGRDPDATLAALLNAAEAEFNASGFHGTDTNRIARRAGYAPQTFYRHFTDKTDVFVAVYERWWKAESAEIGAILSARGALSKVADTMIAFHVKWRGFRRSLRHLSAEDDRVRAARMAARKAQIASVRAFAGTRSTGEIAAALLVFERLCDAVAEDEFSGMGVPRSAGRTAVIAALKDLTG